MPSNDPDGPRKKASLNRIVPVAPLIVPVMLSLVALLVVIGKALEMWPKLVRALTV